MTVPHDTSTTSDDVKSMFRTEQLLVFSVLLLAVFLAMLPNIFNAIIRAGSTPKDPAVGDAAPVASATDLDLRGIQSLVVGGTRGIGRGIAMTIAAGGASVTVIGRDTHKIVNQLQAKASRGPNQTILAYSADLSTVWGSRQIVKALEEAGTQPFDFVFFTVGCWPTYNVPFTADGVERVVALDLLSHHIVLTGLANAGLLKPEARVMNTIASTQNFPFQTRESVQQRLDDSIKNQAPGMVPFTLFPVAVAGDAWLRETSKRYPGMHFVGMFPGVVMSDLVKSSFPAWMIPLLKAGMWSIAISEEQSGLAHVTVLMSSNVGRHGVSFFNHLLEGREAHRVALDDELSAHVYDWLETTSFTL